MNQRNIELLRAAQGKLSSAMNTLESLDGEDVDVSGEFAMHADAIREVVESINSDIDEIEELGAGDELDDDWDDDDEVLIDEEE